MSDDDDLRKLASEWLRSHWAWSPRGGEWDSAALLNAAVGFALSATADLRAEYEAERHRALLLSAEVERLTEERDATLAGIEEGKLVVKRLFSVSAANQGAAYLAVCRWLAAKDGSDA